MAVDLLPGAKGTDYRVVSYGGKVYVVYAVKLPNGGTLKLSWRINPDEMKGFGVSEKSAAKISSSEFKQLNFLGNATEIVRGGEDDKSHPFTKYLKELQKLYGPVSWIENEQFMKVWLEGWVEGESWDVIRQKLTQTAWYKKRTDRERAWELDMNPAQKRAEIKNRTAQVTDALSEIYGVDYDLAELGFDAKAIKGIASKIQSGKWGDPEEGFSLWLSKATNEAEKLEGTNAWINFQQSAEEQRAFLNRPEDMLKRVRDDAFMWLGPGGMPSDETLEKWSTKLVSKVASEADWSGFLQKKAQQLYPWLSPNEPWQEFADPYRRMAEQTWGRPIPWEDPVLGQLGGADANGAPNGAAMTFHDYEVRLRSDDQFWTGPVGQQEGYQLFNALNNVFGGVNT